MNGRKQIELRFLTIKKSNFKYFYIFQMQYLILNKKKSEIVVSSLVVDRGKNKSWCQTNFFQMKTRKKTWELLGERDNHSKLFFPKIQNK